MKHICFLLFAGADQFSSDRRGADLGGGGGVHWCATKELTEHCSSSVTVVGYDLVISHTNYDLQYHTWPFN